MSTKALFSLLLASMLLIAGVVSAIIVINGGRIRQAYLTSFTSEADLLDYLSEIRQSARGGFDQPFALSETLAAGPGAEFSGTNIQVEGVDELDRVKTDGEFIYISSRSQITIIRAYPPEEMSVLHQIPVEDLVGDDLDAHVEGLFILEDKVVVVSGTSEYVAWDRVMDETYEWEPPELMTVVSVLSVTDDSEPILLHSFEISGTYAASRLTSDHVYVITREYVYYGDENITPSYCVDSSCNAIEPADVYYDPEADSAMIFINILAVDPLDGESDQISIIAGYASTVYMSRENLYIAHSTGIFQTFLPGPFGALTGPSPVTSIFRVGVDGTDLWVAAGGSVRGTLLNQFSMDEQGSYLRVVTTDFSAGQVNHVYVLDAALTTVGALEGLAPGETVYSARFVGEALYLVTFKKVDPFFVIDLSVPTSPKVLGFLKIPGFSQYLHPIGNGLVLGVGKEAVEAEEGDFAWFQGLKLSLFDVNDVQHPTEIAKYIIGDRGTESEVLRDHKAFLPMLERGLFSLPVHLFEVNESSYPGEVPPNAYGEPVWQGLYVIKVSPEEGFSLHGTVTHIDEPFDPYNQYGRWVWRSLYIGDYLYTVSDTILKANGIEDMEPINDVIYGTE